MTINPINWIGYKYLNTVIKFFITCKCSVLAMFLFLMVVLFILVGIFNIKSPNLYTIYGIVLSNLYWISCIF